jgi:hypothetical protein
MDWLSFKAMTVYDKAQGRVGRKRRESFGVLGELVPSLCDVSERLALLFELQSCTSKT